VHWTKYSKTKIVNKHANRLPEKPTAHQAGHPCFIIIKHDMTISTQLFWVYYPTNFVPTSSTVYSHLHATLNSSHDWERLLNILAPAIGPKSTTRLFHSLLVTIRLARFLVLSLICDKSVHSFLVLCVFLVFNGMLVLFSWFGYNEINVHTINTTDRKSNNKETDSDTDLDSIHKFGNSNKSWA